MFEWDERKRAWMLAQRGIDFVDVLGVLDDPRRLEVEDLRKDYGEHRFVILCPVEGRLLHVTWTPRGANRRIISARKANERERRVYERYRRMDEGRADR
jgi:uncharacterized DUF497 family protein